MPGDSVLRAVAMTSPRWSWLALALLGAACSDGDKSEETAPSASSSEASTSSTALVTEDDEEEATPQKKGRATEAGQRIEIPAGSVIAGSTPGDEGRHPSFEPPNLEFSLEAFSIDLLPYPNDPAKRPRTKVDRAEAEKLCGEREGRLCTDLEWERACKGPEGDRYAGGKKFDTSCASEPERCASGFGVLSMGGALREWTSSTVPRIKGVVKKDAPVIKGASADRTAVDHRCAHRDVVGAETKSSDLGFRCCYGDRPEASIPAPDWGPTMKRVDFPPDKLAELLRADPKLGHLAKEEIKYFNEAAAKATILRRAKARGGTEKLPDEAEATTAPVVWNPAPGEEILLMTGISGKNSFVLAYHRLPDGRHRLGAAMVMENELGPVVLVYDKYRRRKLQWTTCLDCYGATGNVTYREENRVVITQR